MNAAKNKKKRKKRDPFSDMDPPPKTNDRFSNEPPLFGFHTYFWGGPYWAQLPHQVRTDIFRFWPPAYVVGFGFIERNNSSELPISSSSPLDTPAIITAFHEQQISDLASNTFPSHPPLEIHTSCCKLRTHPFMLGITGKRTNKSTPATSRKAIVVILEALRHSEPPSNRFPVRAIYSANLRLHRCSRNRKL